MAKSLPRKVKVGFSFALGSQPFIGENVIPGNQRSLHGLEHVARVSTDHISILPNSILVVGKIPRKMKVCFSFALSSH